MKDLHCKINVVDKSYDATISPFVSMKVITAVGEKVPSLSVGAEVPTVGAFEKSSEVGGGVV